MLGGFRLLYCGEPVADWHMPRLQSLLAYLILHRGTSQSRAHLASAFWPESTEAQARTNLRGLVLAMRRALPEADRCLCGDASALWWCEHAPCAVDVGEFELAAQATSMAALRRAVELYRGDLLPGCYDEWILPERDRLRQLYLDTLERLATELEACGDNLSAIGYARRLLSADPLREETYRRLMRLYSTVGDRAQAVRTYEECMAVLQHELGVAPDPATRAVYDGLLAAPAPPAGRAATATAPTNLPRHLSSFVGRKQEIAEVKRLLATARLLTLTGAGGCGKTRLALRVAQERVASHPGGVWFVDLATLADPAFVIQAVATVLGVRETPGKPLLETLVTHLERKSLLLVLDNCEHLSDACAMLAEHLLRSCSGVRILTTSRHTLNVPGEVIWRVPSLSLPDLHDVAPSLDHLLEYDATRLFTERALAVQPTFKVTSQNARAIGQVCQRLDGLPLAIEFAAARTSVLSVEQIAARLDDRFRLLTHGTRTAPPRHQTLQAAMAWSYDLLSDRERALLRRLSIFAAGWTLEAAETVCALGNVERYEVLDLLTQLIDKSLVVALTQNGETRYRLLETVRQYGRHRLHEAGEVLDVGRRHRDWYLDLAERADPELRGPNQDAWFERLEADRDNLRAALEWSYSDVSEAESGLRLAGALWWFWFVRSHFTEGRRSFQRLSEVGRGASPVVRARALTGAGVLAVAQGEFEAAGAFLDESLKLSRSVGDRREIAWALGWLGVRAMYIGDHEVAVAYFEESLASCRELGDKWGMARAQMGLGAMTFVGGNPDLARSLLGDSLSRFRELRDKWGTALVLHILGDVALTSGQAERARPLIEESLAIWRDAGDRRGIARALGNLGQVARLNRNDDRAIALWKQSLALFREAGDKRGIAQCLERLAGAAARWGGAVRAARLLGAADALRGTTGSLDNPRHHVVFERDSEFESDLATVQATLGDDAFSAAWAEGRAATAEQAVGYGLEEERTPACSRKSTRSCRSGSATAP